MHDYDVFSMQSKAEVPAKSREYWNPGKTGFCAETGVDLVIDRRDSHFIWDMSGLRLIDVHLNGGTYNLGHRNPELVEAITTGMESFDIANHHFPSSARAALAGALIRSAPPNLTKLAVATGDDRFSRLFLSGRPDEFSQLPFNDTGAMEAALAGGDVAAVIMETIPATHGFPLPLPGYLAAVKALCERHGTLYIADEVQTGLMRTREMWAITKHGIEPAILVTGRGLSGGMYPIAAAVVSEQETGFGVVAHKIRKNEACSLGVFERCRDEDYVSPRVSGRQDRVVAAAGWRRAGPHPVHQPGLQRVLQDHPGAADPQRDRGQPAPVGPRLLRLTSIELRVCLPITTLRRQFAASMLPGQSLLVCGMAAALFAAVAANEAERVAPGNTLVDVTMIGASGRVYVAGQADGVGLARAEIERLLGSISGRAQ